MKDFSSQFLEDEMSFVLFYSEGREFFMKVRKVSPKDGQKVLRKQINGSLNELPTEVDTYKNFLGARPPEDCQLLFVHLCQKSFSQIVLGGVKTPFAPITVCHW